MLEIAKNYKSWVLSNLLQMMFGGGGPQQGFPYLNLDG